MLAISGNPPNCGIPLASFEESEPEFADNSVQFFWRGGLELDHDGSGAGVERSYVQWREIWG